MPQQVTVITHPYGRELTFPETEQAVDEDARLRSLSVFNCLRLLLTLVGQPPDAPKAMFVGGLFAYDLVAGFESLPPLRPGQRCPDYCFYLAETLRLLGYQRAAVIHGGGMDEVALHAPTQVAELRDGAIESYTLSAADFGLSPQPARG